MATSKCPTCGRPETECGIATDCCARPHAECVDCKGRLKVKPAQGTSGGQDAGGETSAEPVCQGCKHPVAVHSAAGPCLLGKGADGKPTLVGFWLKKLPPGVKRCSCNQCQVPETESEDDELLDAEVEVDEGDYFS